MVVEEPVQRDVQRQRHLQERYRGGGQFVSALPVAERRLGDADYPGELPLGQSLGLPDLGEPVPFVRHRAGDRVLPHGIGGPLPNVVLDGGLFRHAHQESRNMYTLALNM